MIIRLMILGISLIAFFALSIFMFEKENRTPKYWTGVIRDLNFRDVGISLSQCSQNKLFFEPGLIFRSTKFFSGWPCEKIHNPQQIYTLNYKPTLPQSYYCERSDGSKHFGKQFNPQVRIRTRDLSQADKWKSKKLNPVFCQYVHSIIEDLDHKKSLLIHCSAGRDRTGMMIGVIAASLMEQKEIPFEIILSLTNCDYQKTASLKKDKYKILETLLIQMKKDSGSVSEFLVNTCDVNRSSLIEAADLFVH